MTDSKGASLPGAAPAQNTDRELWREREGDYYAPSVFVTESGGIGMNVGGFVVVMPIRDWHKLALERPRLALPPLESWHKHECRGSSSDSKAHDPCFCVCGATSTDRGKSWTYVVGAALEAGPLDDNDASRPVRDAAWQVVRDYREWDTISETAVNTLASALGAYDSPERGEAGPSGDSMIANLRAALVVAGHDADCPVLYGASADCVPGTCARSLRSPTDPRAHRLAPEYLARILREVASDNDAAATDLELHIAAIEAELAGVRGESLPKYTLAEIEQAGEHFNVASADIGVKPIE